MTAFRTLVYEMSARPGGLLPARWRVQHVCQECLAGVETADLLAHAKEHELHPNCSSTDRGDWLPTEGGDRA